ncbi:MAG: amidophosphoribosyltransferase [bacterium]
MLRYLNEQARQMKVNDDETPGADRLMVTPENEISGEGKIDKQEESCGIFGVYAPTADVARLTYFGLFALQHRGQESAGIVVSNGAQMACYARMGLVNQVFDESILGILKGYIASGHVRYSTTGSSTIANAQPMLIEGRHLIGNGSNTHSELVSLAIAHNGNLVNTRELSRKCEDLGIQLVSTSDTEIMARLIHHEYRGDIQSALMKTLPMFKGAFSCVIQTPRELIAVRDNPGIRPLVIGYLGDSQAPEGWIVASETCALDIIGAKHLTDVKPGTAIIIDGSGIRQFRWAEGEIQERICAFEYIYFARPDSKFHGKSLHRMRENMGEIMAREHPAEGDIVIPVPDSGTPHSIGYARESGIPYGEGLIKNRYVGRTFISPHERLRALGVRMKLNPLDEALRGKRVIMVDDSIVRGTTSRKIIQLLRDAGAVEVHFRVASPPVLNPCFYGIDTANQDELIANRYHNSNEDYSELAHYLGADSLAYLSIDGMLEAFGHAKAEMCLACLNGDYPIPISAQTRIGLNKYILEKQPQD